MALRDAAYEVRRGLHILRALTVFGVRILVERLRKPKEARKLLPGRVRQLFDDLGLTYVKFGQFLAMRFDLLPADICRSLEELFENVRPIPFEQVRMVVERELNRPLETSFSTFSREPLASASIAQVHEATTAGGERVAVKVQRHGIRELFLADMRILRRFASAADALRLTGTISMRETIDEFSKYTIPELDFVQEGNHADRLRVNASNEVIPRVYWDLTTPRLLTLEFIEGVSLGALWSARRSGNEAWIQRMLPDLSLDRTLHNLAVACLHQLFTTGFFHGDPHPGNILIQRQHRVAMVDFGIFGELRDRDRKLLRLYLEHLALGEFERSFQYYSQLFEPTAATDFPSFKRQTLGLMRHWYRLVRNPQSAPAERLASRFSDEMSLVVRNNRMRMDMNNLLFWRVLIILDSVAVQSAAHFNLLAEMRAFFEQTRAREFMEGLSFAADPEWLVPALGVLREGPARATAIVRSLSQADGAKVRVILGGDRRSIWGDRVIMAIVILSGILAAVATWSAGRLGEWHRFP